MIEVSLSLIGQKVNIAKNLLALGHEMDNKYNIEWRVGRGNYEWQ